MYRHTAPSTSRVLAGRLARDERHPLMLVGSAGTGKVSAIRAYIAEINCRHEGHRFQPFASGENARRCTCLACAKLADWASVDVCYLRGTEPIAELRERVSDFHTHPPKELAHRYLVMRHASLYSKAAMDACLKLMEEPPPDVRIFLTANDAGDLPPAVASRCHVVRHPDSAPDDVDWLVRNVPSLQAYTGALGAMRYTTTRGVVAFQRFGLEAVFKELMHDATTSTAVEERARKLWKDLAFDPDYPPTEARALVVRCLFEFILELNRVNPRYLAICFSVSRFMRSGFMAHLRNVRSGEVINIENQFTGLFLTIWMMRTQLPHE